MSSQEEGEQESLNRTDIAVRSTSASTVIERRRWEVIDLLADGAPRAEIIAATGYRPRTIRQIAQRYRECGPVSLADGRQRSLGAPPILPENQQRDLRQALQKRAPDGGVWTGPKVARWIAARTGKRVHRQRGWEYLRRLGGTAVPASGGQHATHARDDDTNRSAWMTYTAFEQLHPLLDKHADKQVELIDTLAQRVKMLGGVAIAEMRHMAEVTTIPHARWYRGDWITFCATDCSTNCSPREAGLECNRATMHTHAQAESTALWSDILGRTT